MPDGQKGFWGFRHIYSERYPCGYWCKMTSHIRSLMRSSKRLLHILSPYIEMLLSGRNFIGISPTWACLLLLLNYPRRQQCIVPTFPMWNIFKRIWWFFKIFKLKIQGLSLIVSLLWVKWHFPFDSISKNVGARMRYYHNVNICFLFSLLRSAHNQPTIDEPCFFFANQLEICYVRSFNTPI